MSAFTESVVEEAALAWLQGIGWQVRHGAGAVLARRVRPRSRPALFRRPDN